jgi:DNA-binding response OmpR family regulator
MSGELCPCCHQPMPATQQLNVAFDYRILTRNGVTVRLQPCEAQIVQLLHEHYPKSVRHDKIYNHLYGNKLEPPFGDTIRVHVWKIRKKTVPLKIDIVNVLKLGYALVME